MHVGISVYVFASAHDQSPSCLNSATACSVYFVLISQASTSVSVPLSLCQSVCIVQVTADVFSSKKSRRNEKKRTNFHFFRTYRLSITKEYQAIKAGNWFKIFYKA